MIPEIRAAAYRPSRPRPRAATAVLLIAFGGLAAGPARAEYRLAPGDTIEVMVAGLPELKQRYPVQMDGTVAIPVAGRITVEGATTAEVGGRIEAMLARRAVRQRLPDGRDRLLVIESGDVAVAVAEYRPIFVRGDVPAPGQYAYRPQLTVRHALALAGGLPPGRSRAATAMIEEIDVARESRVLMLQLAREHVHAWRIAAELEGAETIKERPLGSLRVAPATLAEFMRSETQALQISRTEFVKERDYLAAAIRQADEQITVLSAQEQEERRGVQADMEELDKTTKLYGGGNLTSQRVAENRRAVLLSSTRRLQTAASLTEAKQRREEYAWRRLKLETQRESNLLRDQRDTQAKLAELKIRLDGLAEKLSVTGRFAGVGSSTEQEPTVTIIRRVAGGWETIPAGLDVELQAGDGVEVTRSAEAEFLQD